MSVIPFIFLCFSAVLMLLSWFNDGPSRRIVSVTFSLFCFIVGVTLVFVFSDDAFLENEKAVLTEKTNSQLLWSLGCLALGYVLGWFFSRRKYTRHGG